MEKQKKFMKEKGQKGITLVALVVTIVVLIILATVTINVVLGDNGLIKKAQQARDMHANSVIEEQEAINTLDAEYSNMLAEPPIVVTGISLDKTKVRIGETVELTATVEPSNASNPSITWSSSDSEVLSVNENGEVTRVSDTVEEIVTITATSTDGSGKTATCEIEVYPIVTTITNTNHENQTTVDKLGNLVEMPNGFKIHEDTAQLVDEGIVITDGTNEFVWVPVNDTAFGNMFNTGTVALSGSTGKSTSYYSNLRITATIDSLVPAIVSNGVYAKATEEETNIGPREPDLVTDFDNDSYAVQAGYDDLADMAQGFIDDYKAMRDSVQKYDGFYIGRYELTGTLENPTVQAGTVLTGYNSGPDGATGNWYYLYDACRNVVTGNKNVTTTMIWGCQWDETMNWLKNTKFQNDNTKVDTDSSSWGNYYDYNDSYTAEDEEYIEGAGSPQETGFSEYWCANKIYDLAGNYQEWTQEAYASKLRVFRGRLLHG